MGIKFILSKYKIIHMGKYNPHYEYHIGAGKLQSDTIEKDIGVLINDNLKPSVQCQKVANTAMAVLNRILRAFTYTFYPRSKFEFEQDLPSLYRPAR